MKPLLALLSALAIAAAMCGCASTQKMYSGAALAPEQTSTVAGTGASTGGLGRGYTTMLIMAVDGKNTNPPNMKPNTVVVAAGTHALQLKCANVTSFSDATLTYDFAPGHVYEIRFQEGEGRTGFNVLDLRSAALYDRTAQADVAAITAWTEAKPWSVKIPVVIHH